MKRNLWLLGLLGSVMTVEPVLASIVIDDFTLAQGPLQRVATGDNGTSISSSASGAGIIGTERDITVSLIGGPGGNRINIVVTPFSSYNHSQDGGITGSSECVWDGVDGAPAVNFTGLGGLDLTESGTQSALVVDVEQADLGASLVFTVYTDASNSSTFTQGFPATATNEIYVIPYASFAVASGTGADFTSVGAIRMLVDGTTVPSLDVILERIDTTPQLTETKTDALFIDVDGDGNVDVGDRIKYTIVITNPDDDGDLPAPGVIFMDTPDPSTSLFVGSVTTTQGIVTTGNTGGDTTVVVNVGNIADAASVTIMFEVTVTAEDPLVCNQGFAGTIPSDDPETPAPLDPTCTPVTFCGDGIVNDVTEECDDGNMNDNDDCSNNCTMGCGNEIINTAEFCDGMAEAPGVDCTLPCRIPGGMDECTCCGDGALQIGSEQCDGALFEPGAPASHGPCRNDCTFCGDGLVNGGEECDDGNENDNDDCSNNCTMGCGNIIINTGEFCDGSAEAPGVDCTLPCRMPGGMDECTCCGDDVLQASSGEQCDGTLFEAGAPASHGPCRTDCTFCGDGLVNGGEVCDDGNNNDNDDCSNNCTMGCGNQIVNTGEFCDGLAEAPGVDCTLPCRTSPSPDSCSCCGDDVLQAGSAEQCDGALFEPGAPASHGPCRNDCTFCGDGLINGGEECDDGNANDSDACSNNCTMGCGNNLINTGEFCDGLAEAPGVDCTLPCRTAPSADSCSCCGDDVLQAGSGEQCDGALFEAGAPVSHGPCRNDCTFCGDNLVNGGEQCDDGNAINNDGCTNACMLPNCGDGVVQPPEQCDDGNNLPGDGCSPICRNEVCGNDVLDPGEECDGTADAACAPTEQCSDECNCELRPPDDGIPTVSEWGLVVLALLLLTGAKLRYWGRPNSGTTLAG